MSEAKKEIPEILNAAMLKRRPNKKVREAMANAIVYDKMIAVRKDHRAQCDALFEPIYRTVVTEEQEALMNQLPKYFFANTSQFRMLFNRTVSGALGNSEFVSRSETVRLIPPSFNPQFLYRDTYETKHPELYAQMLELANVEFRTKEVESEILREVRGALEGLTTYKKLLESMPDWFFYLPDFVRDELTMKPIGTSLALRQEDVDNRIEALLKKVA